MIRAVAVVVAMLAAPSVVGGGGASALQDANPAEGWRTFSGSWSARGQRQVIPAEGGHSAAIVHLSGAVVLASGDLGIGLLGEAIAFDDGQKLSVGRAVWTDQRGDRVFSELKGEPVATGRRVSGTITGGTGRYAGATGDYSLTWQYVAQDVDDVVQGRSVDLRGRLRKGTP
jgi:hypothetical protein